MRVNNSKVQHLVEQQSLKQAPVTKAKPESKIRFADLLQQEMNLKVSGHAQTRLQSRGIDLDYQDWERINEGIARAEKKGSKESLVMIDDVALIVSVKNRTVITAVTQEQLKENVFTNIDSAVFV